MSLSINDVINNLVDVNDIQYDRSFSRVAKLHKYWSRKPWYIVKDYIATYSQEDDLVLDPFCGSGIIGLEAVLGKRKFVGYDLNPFAVFLANNTMDLDYDEKYLSDLFKHLESQVSEKIMNLYSVAGDRYILYTILGEKNSANHNAVTANKNFKDKSKEVLSEEYLKPKIRFPKNLSFPDKEFPKKFYKDRFSYKGVSKVSDMFTKRNLTSLAILYDAIQKIDPKDRSLFMLAFTNTLLHVSKLKAENVRPLGVNNFWIPDDYIEENVWWRFVDRLQNVRIAKKTISERSKRNVYNKSTNFKVFNKSSLNMEDVKSASVDYLITDPPYGDTIQYSELSYIWNCWLEKEFQIEEEVIINPVQNKGFQEYRDQLQQFVNQVKRVLKKDAYFTLAFQNKDLKIWVALAELIRDSGMQVIDISSYDTFGSPYNKNWSKFSPKSDFYVTFKNTDEKMPVHKGAVESHDVAGEIIEALNVEKSDLFNLNKAYDLFVASVLIKVFDGYHIHGHEKLNVEKVINLFEDMVNQSNYGNIQTGLFQNISN